MEINTILFFGLTLFILLTYRYFTRNFNYWSKRGIDGPRPKPIFGNFIDQFLMAKAPLEKTWLRKYGKIYGIYNANKPVLVVAEPELIQRILVKDFHLMPNRIAQSTVDPILLKSLFNARGEDWKRIRSVVTPTFSSAKMKGMYLLIKQSVAQFLGAIELGANVGDEVNIKALFGNYSMDVIATCAFATKINAQKDPNNTFLRNASKVLSSSVWRILPFLLLPRFVLKTFKLTAQLEPRSNEYFFNLTRSIINERQNNNKKHIDFIQLLLNGMKNGIESKDNYITEEEIIAQSWTFFAVGFESASTTLSFASYELALNQDIQQRLYEEVVTAVDANGDIDYYSLSRLPFLDSVVSETLRIHTPFVFLERKAIQDFTLGSTGITIEKGQVINIPIHAIHNSEEFYKQPSRFDPERFMPENKNKIVPYTYLPFSAGPRNCVAMRFVLMEIKACLAHFIRRFRLTRVDNTEVPLMLNNNPFIHSPKRVIVGIQMRQ